MLVCCHVCQAETEPYAEMGADDSEIHAGVGPMVWKCAQCRAPVGDSVRTAESANEHRVDCGSLVERPRSAAGASALPTVAAIPAEMDCGSIVELAKRRLETVRAKLAEMKSLQEEAEKLELIVSALAL